MRSAFATTCACRLATSQSAAHIPRAFGAEASTRRRTVRGQAARWLPSAFQRSGNTACSAPRRSGASCGSGFLRPPRNGGSDTLLAFQRNELFSCLGVGANIVDQRQCRPVSARRCRPSCCRQKGCREVGNSFFINRCPPAHAGSAFQLAVAALQIGDFHRCSSQLPHGASS